MTAPSPTAPTRRRDRAPRPTHRPRSKRLAVPVVALALGVALALPGAAAAGPLGQRGGPPPGGGPPPPGQIGAPPSPADTPELGSLLLFGGGAAGLGGYALAQARRRLPSRR